MTAHDTAAGSAIYTPAFLRFLYDWGILGFYCTYAWSSPAARLAAFFDRNVSSAVRTAHARGRGPRILDVGVGTGYFPGRCKPLSKAAAAGVGADGCDLVLADLNPDCLAAASERVARELGLASRTVRADFLEADAQAPLALTRERVGAGAAGEDGFDAVACMFLLHCVPGPPARKAEALIRLGALLGEDGVLFRVTILGKGVTHNLLGRWLMLMHNLVGIFDNRLDDVSGLMGPLHDAFESVQWEIVGRTVFFEARHPKEVATG